MEKQRYYIAYGSNMNLRQMSKRCPTASVIATGYVKGYELLFKGSMNMAVATIEPNKQSKVPVVLWSIKPLDEARLDIYEGYPRFYRKEENIPVSLSTGEVVQAMAYIMNIGTVNLPSRMYYKTIEEGYFDNDLDIEYLKKAVEKCKKSIKNRSV